MRPDIIFTAPSNRERISAVFFALLVSLVYIASIRPGHVWGDDFAMYLLQAKHCSEGQFSPPGQYLYNPMLPVLGPPSYPPLYPLLLAPVIYCFGLNLHIVKILQVLLFAIAVCCLFELLFLRVGYRAAMAVLAIFCLSPYVFATVKDNILSDIPFTLFVVLSLLLIERSERCEWKRTGLAVSVGIAAYACFATRTVGLAIFPALISHAVYSRRIHRNNILSLSIAGCLAGVQFSLLRAPASYLEQAHGLIRAVPQNLHIHAYNVGRILFAAPGAVAWADVLIVSLLVAAALARQVRIKLGATEGFFIAYSVIIVLWPSDNDPRFLIPLFPLALMYAAVFVTNFSWSAMRPLAWGFMVLLLVGYVRGHLDAPRGPITEGIGDENFLQVCRFLKEKTPRAAVVLFAKAALARPPV